MPQLIAPRSNMKCLSLLQTSLKKAEEDLAAGKIYLAEETVQSITAIIGLYEQQVTAMSKHLGVRSQELKEENEAIRQTELTIRHLWTAIKNRVIRLNQPVSVLNFYGLPQDGKVPKSVGIKNDVIVMADRICEGDAQAVAQGYDPVLNPSAEELKQYRDIAKKEADEAREAVAAYNEAQDKISEIRPQVNQLIRDVIDEMKFFLRRKDAVTRRKIMGSYGFSFKYMEGETRDPEETPDEA